MINQTIVLYDLDAYQEYFNAKVLSCIKEERDGTFRVILDQTCFFPEQGGQSADKGWINDVIHVLDVKIKNGIIEHITDQPLPVGVQVQGKIDFKRRFDFMQHHTGEHIFSGLVYNTYGYYNVGFHLSDRTVTMDYDGFLSLEEVKAIEWQVNQVIWKNLPVTVSWPDDSELEHISYRSKKEIDGKLRLVTIPGVDICACCAPHVHRTGEIGQLRVISAMRYKGGTRLHILCGGRALQSAQQNAAILSETCQLLSCSNDNINSQIKSLLDKEKALKETIEKIQTADLMKKANEATIDKINVVMSAGQISEKTASTVADRLIQDHSGVCGVIFQDGTKQRIVLVSRSVPLRTVAQQLRQSTGFKGGGDDGCIRGTIEMDADQLEKWLDSNISLNLEKKDNLHG